MAAVEQRHLFGGTAREDELTQQVKDLARKTQADAKQIRKLTTQRDEARERADQLQGQLDELKARVVLLEDAASPAPRSQQATQTETQPFSKEELEAWIPVDKGTQCDPPAVTKGSRSYANAVRQQVRPRDQYNMVTDRSVFRSEEERARKSARAVSALRQQEQELAAARRRSSRPASEPQVEMANRMWMRRHFVLSGTKEILAQAFQTSSRRAQEFGVGHSSR